MADNGKTYDYDVALSFAGEDRAYLEQVARILHELGVRVFYDRYEMTDMWGKDLYTHLDDVYQKRSRFCVMFISQHYGDKVWTSHERTSAQARALASAGEYVLPARFDDTEIPGVRPTVAFLDLRTSSPGDVAKAILVKLGRQTELDEMVAFLTNYLGSYEVTIEGTDLHFRSEEEQFEASFPIRLLLEMYRVNQLENMFLLPGLLRH